MRNFLLTACLVALPFTANAAVVTVGPTDSGADCTFACMVRTQQAYDSSYFTETINITEVSFFSTGSSTLYADYDFYIGYMDGDYTSITTDFNSNIGNSYQLFDSTTFSHTFLSGDIISFNGSFTYDPSLGDLLIDIVRSNETGGNHGQMATNSGSLSRALQWPLSECYSGCLESVSGYGISTQFVGATVVPVPAAVWLFGSGLLGLIGVARRKEA